MIPSRLLGPLLLLGLWLALWGEVSWANLASGILVIGAVAAIRSGEARTPGYRVHPVGLARLLGAFVVDLTRGSFRVARAVVAPTEARLADALVDVRLGTDRSLIVNLVADLVSLVPGSLTVDASTRPGEGTRLRVHVMGPGHEEAEVRAAVARLEALALGALEPIEDAPRASGGGRAGRDGST